MNINLTINYFDFDINCKPPVMAMFLYFKLMNPFFFIAIYIYKVNDPINIKNMKDLR